VTQTSAGRKLSPVPFDAFKLSAGGDLLEGSVDANALPRVADRLAVLPGDKASEAPIKWRIDGDRDPSGRSALTVTIEGSVPLVCQRCLQAFEFKVDQQTMLLLARNEAQLVSLDNEEPEVVLASGPLDARSLVEDEKLLSLPFAPRHPEGECEAAPVTSAGDMKSGKESELKSESPFARLSALKNGNT